jgi:microcin C transport system substrate-binding protein
MAHSSFSLAARSAAPLMLLAALAAAGITGTAQAGGMMKRHHALSLVGEPKLPADFKHFDWVNPDAPKGGSVRQMARHVRYAQPFQHQG